MSEGIERIRKAIRQTAPPQFWPQMDRFMDAYAHELAEQQRDRLAAGLHMPGYARVLCNNGQFEPLGSTHLIDGIDPEMGGVNRPAREALAEISERKPSKKPDA